MTKAIPPNAAALEEARSRGSCEWCYRRCRPHPHHILARGMGGGGRLDVALNLVALCFVCHRLHHDGHEPSREQLLGVVARRERRPTGRDVLEELWGMLRGEAA